MKLMIRNWQWLMVMLVFGSLAAFVVAQQTASTVPESKLDQVVALLHANKVQEAKALIATIDKSDPAYPAARCYNALCLFEQKEYLACLQEMNSLELENAAVAPELREEVAARHIEVLFYFRRFEDLLVHTRTFQTSYAKSKRLNAVAEYRMGTLFERGMKKVHESTKLKDPIQFDRRWTDGKTNLQEFLSLATAFRSTNYNVLQKRSLKADIWVARLVLGDENAALEEIQTQDAASREKFGLLRVQLHEKLQPEELDNNLARLSDFLRDFPESTDRPRVEFDMTVLNFRRGKQLSNEADAAEKAGDTRVAARKRAQAIRYFEAQRALQRVAVADKASGIEASDIVDLREDLLYSYLLQKDYATLATLTASMIAESAVGDPTWLVAKVHDGIALMQQSPPASDAAAEIFDAILVLNFNGQPDQDRVVAIAARWRVNIAFSALDMAKAKQVAQLVESGNCTRDIKEAFLKDHASLLASPNQ